MSKPRVLVISGYGLNCEVESCYAWELAGADPVKIHLSDLLEVPSRLHGFGALMFIGGFSFGDHMGSGQVFALRLLHRMKEDLGRFVDEGKLVLGICNGFQIMVKLGILPGLDRQRFTPQLALIQNDCGSFQNRWVHIRFEPESPCIATRGLGVMPLPIRHGEGKLFTPDSKRLEQLEREHCVAARYVDPDTGQPALDAPGNPNGSLNAIAGVCDPSGKIFGMMPHPEAYLYPENHPHWDFQAGTGSLPDKGLGLKVFQNVVDYLKS